jgi:hypothetical protein
VLKQSGGGGIFPVAGRVSSDLCPSPFAQSVKVFGKADEEFAKIINFFTGDAETDGTGMTAAVSIEEFS